MLGFVTVNSSQKFYNFLLEQVKTTKSIQSSSSRVEPSEAMASSVPSSSTLEMESGQVLLPSSSPSEELEIEDGIEDENEKVEFDINTIVKQLEMQPKVEVHDV